MSLEARLAGGESAKLQGGKKATNKRAKREGANSRRSFFAAVSLLIGGDRERVKMQGPIAGMVM